jgi:HTH-type transcriptional regulator/antitoxin HigA
MDIRPIKTEADYEATLEEIECLMDAAPGTAEADRLDVLTSLVESYEARVHPVEAPDPVEAIRHALEANGGSERDLQRILRIRPSTAREIMHRKRPLTLEMIRRLNQALNIPADVLIQPYKTEGRNRVSS